MKMQNIHSQTPIIIGVGQSISRWDSDDITIAPSPVILATRAAKTALDDSGRAVMLTENIDRVIFVRTMLDSMPWTTQPFGRCENLPATLAAKLNITNAKCIYSVVGGEQPQALVNEAAEAIYAGEACAILLAGAEATAAMKKAQKNNIKLDWSTTVDAELQDRGLGPMLLSPYEMHNGLGLPAQTYPVFEHALRARLGHSRDTYAQLMSELWANFSKIAASHPYAQFPKIRSADFIRTVSKDNYPVADPYLKWHVAQDAVNQGAAVILTSVGQATKFGIDPAKWIYLHGYAKATDKLVTERADLSRSVVMELASSRALKAAQKNSTDISHFDLYSCFPCAVLLATETLQLNWRTTPATVTGGLPFFGGAGNNYSMHGIATMVERLRAHPNDFGLVLANGGFLSKVAVGIYSTQAKPDWSPVSSADIQSQIDDTPAVTLLSEATRATVETYTTVTTKGYLSYGYIMARTETARILAQTRAGDTNALEKLSNSDPLGMTVSIIRDNSRNVIAELMDA